MSETKIKVPEERLLRVVDKVGLGPTVRECCTAFAEDLSENPIVPSEADVMEILQERVRSHHISGEEYCAIPPATVRFVIREWERRMFLASPEPCDNPVVQRVVQRGQRFKVGDDIWQVKFQNGDMATLEKIAPEPETSLPEEWIRACARNVPKGAVTMKIYSAQGILLETVDLEAYRRGQQSK